MQLAAVKPEDIVRVDKKGRVFVAFVIAKRRGALEIEPISHGISYTTATAREVTGHWAQRKPAHADRATGNGRPCQGGPRPQ
jgi:hypothetical protein